MKKPTLYPKKKDKWHVWAKMYDLFQCQCQPGHRNIYRLITAPPVMRGMSTFLSADNPGTSTAILTHNVHYTVART